jgi:hypothetical protein
MISLPYISFPPGQMDAVVLFVIMIGLLATIRMLFAWWDARSLRKQEEIENMIWRRMR